MQRKKALESKQDGPKYAESIGAQGASDALKLKTRKMTEDDKKVRFMIDQIENNEDIKDDSPVK